VWDLNHYRRLHHLLQDVARDKRSEIRVALSSNPGDFFIKTDHSMHCPNDNTTLTDEVQEMDRKDVQMVALGLDGCAIILSKEDGAVDLIRKPALYQMLKDDLKKYGKVQGKIVCVRLCHIGFITDILSTRLLSP
jgi:hypothetical protein